MNQFNFRLLCLNNSVFTGLILFMVLLVSCEMEPVPLTTNSVIVGCATTQSSIDRYVNDSVLVTAYGPYGPKSAMTEKGPYFTLTGLGNGTYYLEYTKNGYGTMRQYGIQLFGNDTAGVETVRLFKKPGPEKLPAFKKAYTGIRPRSYPEKIWICIDTDVTIQNQNKFGYQFILFMDTDENVSWKKHKLGGIYWDGQFNDNTWTIYIELNTLRYYYLENIAFNKGDRVYVRGYPCNNEEQRSPFLDTYCGIRQYSTLDKTRSTNVVSFIMP